MARGGSKRIPNKNIKDFHGKPIIHYSIAAALSSECFERVIVSTDSKKIAEISRNAGAEVPFLRSEKNSNDEATTPDALLEVLNELQSAGDCYDAFCCIYPTAPFIKAERLKDAQNLLLEKPEIDGVIPIVPFSYPIQRSLRLENQYVHMVDKSLVHTRSQDLETRYHDAGQFYYLNTKKFLETTNLWNPKVVPILLPECEVQDIDNEMDWKIAEMKYEIMEQNKIITLLGREDEFC